MFDDFPFLFHLQNMHPQKTASSVGSGFVLILLQDAGTVPRVSVRTAMDPNAELDEPKLPHFCGL